MNILFELQKYAQLPIPTQVLLNLLKDYKRPYDKIGDLVEKGYLVQLKKGLYIAGKPLNTSKPELFLVANHMYGPSYISCESALFYWGLIPEKVYQISSITNRPSKEFDTDIGFFTYTHVPTSYYMIGMTMLKITDKQTILMAQKEKALCDKIVTTFGIHLRSKKQVLEFLTEDLRIEIEDLKQLDTAEMRSWLITSKKKASIKLLIDTLIEL